MEFQKRLDPFRWKSTERSCGLRNLPLSGECSRAALRFNIEELVSAEIKGGSYTGFGSAKMPSILRRTEPGREFTSGRKLNEINGLRGLKL